MKWFGCWVPAVNTDSVSEIFQPEASGPAAPVSCYATGVLKASPPPPPLRPLPDFIVWKLVASEGSASEGRAGWTSSGVRGFSPLRSSERVIVSFLLKNRCDGSVLGCVCATPAVRLHLNTSVRTTHV